MASREASTKKTTTVLIAMKQSSDGSHTLAPNSTIQSIDLAKSRTSLPIFCDDMESPAARNKIIMDSFNGVAKTTIGRGKEEKLAGQILTFNVKEGERIPEKIDEGRLLIQVYEKVPETLSVEDSYEEKTAFNLAMAEPELPRDFLARFGCRFQQKPGIRGVYSSLYQDIVLEGAPIYSKRGPKGDLIEQKGNLKGTQNSSC